MESVRAIDRIGTSERPQHYKTRQGHREIRRDVTEDQLHDRRVDEKKPR
jgi:hypothetical protein